jgi:transposase
MISTEVYMNIIALKRQGHSVRWIARKLGIHRKTVKKHLESNSFPAYTRKTVKPSILEPYHQVIRDFLDEDDYQPESLIVSSAWDTPAVTALSRFLSVRSRNRSVELPIPDSKRSRVQVDWGDSKIVDSSGATTTV